MTVRACRSRVEPRADVRSSAGARGAWAGLLALLLVGCTATVPRALPATAKSASATPARDPGPLPAIRDRNQLAFTLENDLFTGSDSNYTNGLVLSWTSRRKSSMEEGSPLRRWIEALSFLPFTQGARRDVHATLSIGQEIFTPDDIELVVPEPDDQPYAGVLFADLGLLSRSKDTSHVWRARIGLVGPSALGEQAQRSVHEIIGGDIPNGWDAQLPDEPILNLDYGVSHELYAGGEPEDFAWRLTPAGGLGLGNYFTGASGSLRAECGWNLPRTVGFPSLRHGMNTLPWVESGTGGRWSVSFFAGAGGFLVAHYLPLDGTVFEDSPSVDSEPLVGVVSAGFAVRKRRLAIGYQVSLFTDTFETQRDPTEFGTLTLSWSY